MDQSSRATNSFLRQQFRPYTASGRTVPSNEHTRIARALLGVTPAQLAAHIGVPPRPTPHLEQARPAHTLHHLSTALRTVIGWYREGLGEQSETDELAATETEALDDLLPKYLALRSNWENRGATTISAALSTRATTAIIPQSATPIAAVPAPGSAPSRALLVDDVSDVLVTISSFLETFGFEVIRASDADSALRVLSGGTPIDLLVTDYAMPGMTGKDLAVQACELRAQLRALIITGYPDAEELARLPARVMLLAKPFRRLELAERIHQLFAGKVSDYESRKSLQEADGA